MMKSLKDYSYDFDSKDKGTRRDQSE